MYSVTIPEEELKNKVALDFFSDFDTTQILGEIDFCVSFERQSLFENSYFLWAEAKKGKDSDILKSFTQLILTIAKHKHHHKHQPPPFLGAFDAEKIAFIEYSKLMEFLDKSDFDYLHTTPSNIDSPNFQKMHTRIKDILESNIRLFKFSENNAELVNFIAQNFILGNANLTQIQITSDNFVHIYIKWLNAVKPSIDIDWNEARKEGILDTDFYLADMLSVENKTLKDKLYIILDGSRYALLKGKNKIGLFEKSEVLFNDSQVAHKQFWNRYERPPATKFWNEFINRRDLLVPEDIRERKGAFYTPQIWVQKAHDYLAESLGEDWQEQYYIWDCAAGTGNLLAGLKNARNIFASTIDLSDVLIMKELNKNDLRNCRDSRDSAESSAVFKAGLALWRYYHKCAKNSDCYLNDASLYDIKEFFQGRAESSNGKKGKMNAKSDDSHYNDLIAELRIALQNLADKITPKIYEYEFLRE